MKNELLNILISIKKQIKYIQNYNHLHKRIDTNSYSPLPQEQIIKYNMSRYNGAKKYICLAPFTNLFFDIRGKVVVCNQNRTYTIGDIHKETIEEIWKGDKLKKIKEYIENFDFSLGCNKCSDAILSKNYHGLPALSYDSTPSIQKDYPIRMEFEMENTCNLACKMCNSYFSSSYQKHFKVNNDSPLPYPADFTEQLIPFIPNLRYTKFTGGEPFLIPVYFDIWEKIIHMNPSCGIHVQTNGLVLNNKTKEVLEKGRFYIGVSLDSASKTIYEKIRINGNFDRLKQNLDYFKDYCQRKKTILNIPFTPTRDSLYEIQDFPDFANQYNAFSFFNIVWEPHSVAIWTLPSDELRRALNFHRNQKIKSYNYLSSHNKKQYEFYVNQIAKWLENALEREKKAEKFNDKSNEELISFLIKNLIEYEKGDCRVWINDKKIENPKKNYSEKFHKKLEEQPEKTRQILINLCTYDIERVYMEMSNFSHLW